MKQIQVIEKNNGYLVRVSGGVYASGDYVFKSTETLSMLELIGELFMDAKVTVTRR